jgi:hypothetical protein
LDSCSYRKANIIRKRIAILSEGERTALKNYHVFLCNLKQQQCRRSR